ncbi:MAG: hypothetical protein ACPGXK_10620 [Phycisphaerae bacterium]
MATYITLVLSMAAVANAEHSFVGGIAHSNNLLIADRDGKVAISPDGVAPSESYLFLPRIDAFLQGWSNNDPGFNHIPWPTEELAPLPAGSSIVFEVVGFDSSFVAIDLDLEIIGDVGDTTVLGNTFLHQHFTWFVDENDEAFNPEQCVWEAHFILWDESEWLEPSETYTLLFTNRNVRNPVFPATGDGNRDGSVTRADHREFVECFSGPENWPQVDQALSVDCEVTCHNAYDFDNDLDVDLRDFADWQVKLTP